MANGKKLSKSTTDRKWLGVAGGIAEYFDVDPSLVRLAFLLFTIAGGPGLIVYIILAIILGEERPYYEDNGYAKVKNDERY